MTGTYALRDSTTMLRRNLRHLQRYPGLSLFPILGPVVFLLLFVYVFGGTLGNGISAGGGRGAYVNFLTPGILLFAAAGAATTTAISVAKDMTEGIIARFKTMRIWRPAVLTGHVAGGLILTLISLAVVIVVALLDRLPRQRRPTQMVGRTRAARAAGRRAHLAVGRLRPKSQERRDRKQHADVLDPPAVSRQRLRTRRLDARGLALVR